MSVVNPSASGLTSGAGPKQYQTVRTASQAFGANASTDVTITWPVAFADANYTVLVTIVAEDVSNSLLAGQNAIKSKTATSVVARVQNADALNPHNGHVEAIAIHD
jgi:hypothetical protein